jgi:hypothetical protein
LTREQITKQRLSRAGESLKKFLEAGKDGSNTVTQNRAEEHSLVSEMQKNRPFGDFGSLGDVIESRGCISVDGKLLKRSSQYLLPSLRFFRSPSLGLFAGLHCSRLRSRDP